MKSKLRAIASWAGSISSRIGGAVKGALGFCGAYERAPDATSGEFECCLGRHDHGRGWRPVFPGSLRCKGGTNVVSFIPAGNDDVAIVRSSGKKSAAQKEAAADRQRGSSNRPEGNFRLSGDQAGKKPPAKSVDSRQKSSDLARQQSEEKFRMMYEAAGKNFPASMEDQVGKEIPPQSEDFFRQSYRGLTEDPEDWIGLQ